MSRKFQTIKTQERTKRRINLEKDGVWLVNRQTSLEQMHVETNVFSLDALFPVETVTWQQSYHKRVQQLVNQRMFLQMERQRWCRLFHVQIDGWR